jgi:hypothetical protein
MDQAVLSLQNAGGRKFSFVVSEKVSENVQLVLVDHSGMALRDLIVVESADTSSKGSCLLSGFQLNARIESGFYRLGICYNSQCSPAAEEIYIDNRVLDYSNISGLFLSVMLISACISPLFFVANLIDNSRALLLIPAILGVVIAFASEAYNLVSLQPVVGKIYVNFRSVAAEELLLSSMLLLVCVVLVLSSLFLFFLDFLFPKFQFHESKCNALQMLFGRIGGPDAIIKGYLRLEDSRASSIRTEGLFIVQVAPRSSVFLIPQVSAATLMRHFWTMASGHIQKLYYRVYNTRPYRDTLYERTTDFVFPQRVSSTILLLAFAIVSVSFFFYFVIRKLQYTIAYCRMLYTEAVAYSDLYLWEQLPVSVPPFYLDSERTPLFMIIIYDFIANTWIRSTTFYLELLSSFALSTGVSVVLASIVISVVVMRSMAIYRQEMMLARKGKLDWGPFRGLSGGTRIENAARYLGAQTVAYVMGWLFILLVLFAPIFALTWSPVRRFFVARIQNFAILAFLIVLLGFGVSKLSRHLALNEKGSIRNRKAFSYLEAFSLPLHYAVGFFLCLWRTIMAIFAFLSSITPLSSPLYVYSDPAYASYRAAQYIDHLHNCPSIFSLATSLIAELDRRYIRLNTPTTAEPSLIQLEIRNLEQAEGKRKLIAAWQHLCVFANNDIEFSLRARRYESKYAVGIRVQPSANLIFGAGAKAQKSESAVNVALYVPPKFSSRASILAHNFAIRQERIKARSSAAVAPAFIDSETDVSIKKKGKQLDEPTVFIPAAARVTQFQEKLNKELQPKAFAMLPSNSGGPSELKDLVGGQGVLAFEKELQKLSIRRQLSDDVDDGEEATDLPTDEGALAAVEELPSGLRERALGGSKSAGRPVTHITQTYRMAQNEMHRRDIAERMQVGSDDVEAKVKARNDLLLSRETLDSLAKEARR